MIFFEVHTVALCDPKQEEVYQIQILMACHFTAFQSAVTDKLFNISTPSKLFIEVFWEYFRVFYCNV